MTLVSTHISPLVVCVAIKVLLIHMVDPPSFQPNRTYVEELQEVQAAQEALLDQVQPLLRGPADHLLGHGRQLGV